MLGSTHSTPRPISVLFAVVATGAFVIFGCDAVGPASDDGQVSVRFKTVSPSFAKSGAVESASGPDSLVISGSNGTLTLTDVRLVVSEIELEGEADSAEFESVASFLDLPLDTNEVAPIAADAIPAGQYTEFEFEVEDVDLDEEEDEDDEEDQLRALRDSIHATFPEWPDEASMVAVGSFRADGDPTRPFTTYFEAELEVERELRPPLDVADDAFSRQLTVKLDPSQWFASSGDAVLDLSQYDYEKTEELVELEFEDGVVEVETDEDDDDEDDDEEDDDTDD